MHFATRSIYRLQGSLRPFFFSLFKATQKWIILNTFFYSEKSESFHRKTYLFSIYTLSDLGDQAIWLVRCFNSALGGEYKAEQNRCRELGVCQRFRVRTFLKIQEYPSVDDLEGKKKLHGV